jgi:hypothetical protein
MVWRHFRHRLATLIHVHMLDPVRVAKLKASARAVDNSAAAVELALKPLIPA